MWSTSDKRAAGMYAQQAHPALQKQVGSTEPGSCHAIIDKYRKHSATGISRSHGKTVYFEQRCGRVIAVLRRYSLSCTTQKHCALPLVFLLAQCVQCVGSLSKHLFSYLSPQPLRCSSNSAAVAWPVLGHLPPPLAAVCTLPPALHL
jgi:hypothetical protein